MLWITKNTNNYAHPETQIPKILCFFSGTHPCFECVCIPGYLWDKPCFMYCLLQKIKSTGDLHSLCVENDLLVKHSEGFYFVLFLTGFLRQGSLRSLQWYPSLLWADGDNIMLNSLDEQSNGLLIFLAHKVVILLEINLSGCLIKSTIK